LTSKGGGGNGNDEDGNQIGFLFKSEDKGKTAATIWWYKVRKTKSVVTREKGGSTLRRTRTILLLR